MQSIEEKLMERGLQEARKEVGDAIQRVRSLLHLTNNGPESQRLFCQDMGAGNKLTLSASISLLENDIIDFLAPTYQQREIDLFYQGVRNFMDKRGC